MGMEDGLKEAMSQMDEVLADLTSFARKVGTTTDLLSDTQVRISRIIGGTLDQVWHAHHDPELLKVWLLGPDGWIMPVCEVSTRPTDRSRPSDSSATSGSPATRPPTR